MNKRSFFSNQNKCRNCPIQIQSHYEKAVSTNIKFLNGNEIGKRKTQTQVQDRRKEGKEGRVKVERERG